MRSFVCVLDLALRMLRWNRQHQFRRIELSLRLNSWTSVQNETVIADSWRSKNKNPHMPKGESRIVLNRECRYDGK